MKRLGDYVFLSAERIKEAENDLAKSHDRYMKILLVQFLRQESTILLRRAWKFWWGIRKYHLLK